MLREYAAAAAQSARVRDVRAQGARFAERSDVLDTVAGALTSQDLVAAERRLIAAAVGRAGEASAVVGAAALERALAGAERPLTDEASAVRAVATSATASTSSKRWPEPVRHSSPAPCATSTRTPATA